VTPGAEALRAILNNMCLVIPTVSLLWFSQRKLWKFTDGFHLQPFASEELLLKNKEGKTVQSQGGDSKTSAVFVSFHV